MTGIDTYEARKHWKDETQYLDRIGFVGLNGQSRITFLTDEEGNGEIILTPRAARFVAARLIGLAKGAK